MSQSASEFASTTSSPCFGFAEVQCWPCSLLLDRCTESSATETAKGIKTRACEGHKDSRSAGSAGDAFPGGEQSSWQAAAKQSIEASRPAPRLHMLSNFLALRNNCKHMKSHVASATQHWQPSCPVRSKAWNCPHGADIKRSKRHASSPPTLPEQGPLANGQPQWPQHSRGKMRQVNTRISEGVGRPRRLKSTMKPATDGCCPAKSANHLAGSSGARPHGA